MRILLVDDEPTIRITLADALEEAGHQVSAVEHGRAALERHALDRHEFIIADVLMPEISGLDCLRRLRAQDDHTPVLIISAVEDQEDAAFQAGACGFIHKPFYNEEVVEFLKRYRAGEGGGRFMTNGE